MQAAKIFPETVYAIKGRKPDQNFARFKVTAVVTRRTRNTGSPHDHKSVIEGFVIVDDRREGEDGMLTLEPDHILGEYKAFIELTEREAAEKAAARAADEAAEARHDVQWRKLYAFAGLSPPEQRKGRHGSIEVIGKDHFRRGYKNSGFDISEQGAEALIAAIDKVMKEGVAP